MLRYRRMASRTVCATARSCSPALALSFSNTSGDTLTVTCSSCLSTPTLLRLWLATNLHDCGSMTQAFEYCYPHQKLPRIPRTGFHPGPRYVPPVDRSARKSTTRTSHPLELSHPALCPYALWGHG